MEEKRNENEQQMKIDDLKYKEKQTIVKELNKELS